MVYVHVPFCRSFCIYCDFYSEIACRGRDAGQIEGYTGALCAEIAARREETARTLGVNTLYFGGGTPSVLPPPAFERIVGALGCGPFDEFTVEVNPEDIVEKGGAYVSELLKLGVNRVSMGVQSLDDGILRWMRRRHDYATARRAFGILRDAGVENVSLDLIFGLPQLSREMLSDTLDGICGLRPEHVSAYQLSVEEGSDLAAMAADGRFTEASEELCAGQYEMICSRLQAAGYVHYEISNWALPGREAKHNSAYWERVPYVGFGPGAHSFDGERRSWNSCELSGWSGSGELLTEAEAREERIMLGLRTARGIPVSWCRPADLRRCLADGSIVAVADALPPEGSVSAESAGASPNRLPASVRIPESRWFVSDDIVSGLI